MINCVYQPSKAVSLLAILKHDAAAFWEISKMLEQMCPSKMTLNFSINELLDHCETLDLRVSKMEIHKFGLRKDVSSDEIVTFGRHLSSIIHSELQTKIFMFVAKTVVGTSKAVGLNQWVFCSISQKRSENSWLRDVATLTENLTPRSFTP
jgi:hypothetical protein